MQRTTTSLGSETHSKELSTSKILQTREELVEENVGCSTDDLASPIKKISNIIPNHKDYVERYDHCARSRGSFWLMASSYNNKTIKDFFEVDNKATANTNSSCARTRIITPNKMTPHSS